MGDLNRIQFDLEDTESFYDRPMILPAGAVWNMDEVLMAYIAAGLEWLLEKGCTDFDYWDEQSAGLRPTTVRIREIIELCKSYDPICQDAATRATMIRNANDGLVLLSGIGVERLWD